MQATAAQDRDFGRKPLALALLAALVGGSSGAFAAERLGDGGKHIVRPGKVDARTPASGPMSGSMPGSMSRCASYGEGFVPVVGSDSCVKIGGRLRIDLGGSMAAPVFSGPRDGISPAAHVRVGR